MYTPKVHTNGTHQRYTPKVHAPKVHTKGTHQMYTPRYTAKIHSKRTPKVHTISTHDRYILDPDRKHLRPRNCAECEVGRGEGVGRVDQQQQPATLSHLPRQKLLSLSLTASNMSPTTRGCSSTARIMALKLQYCEHFPVIIPRDFVLNLTSEQLYTKRWMPGALGRKIRPFPTSICSLQRRQKGLDGHMWQYLAALSPSNSFSAII